MKRKGINFRHSPGLYYRSARPEDMERCTGHRTWSESLTSYVVIIRKKDCVDGNGNWSHELAQQAPCLPFDGWSRTNMVYGGTFRKQTRGARFWVHVSDLTEDQQCTVRDNDELHDVRWDDDAKTDGMVAWWFDTYWTCTTYWVEGGAVCTASSRMWRDPAQKAA